VFSIIRWLEEIRADGVARLLKPHVEGAALDVGCWNGDVTRRLDHPDIVGVDVAPHPRPLIKIVPFDGRKIPFPDQAFQTVLCSTVLHHALDQDALLEEMKRVGRKLVILEDDVDAPLNWLSVVLLHALGSRLVTMPYQIRGFRTRRGWEELFAAHGLRIDSYAPVPGIQPFWLFLRHHLYVLRPR
jgi:ubiquinone/menaquinone biosynthesis C-methylase UbiE